MDERRVAMEEALQAIESMIRRSEDAQGKFAPGTSQHTLQQNRIKALYIAAALIKSELEGTAVEGYAEDDLQKAAAPLASLKSKSEKALQKLAAGTWQHTMLENNIEALRRVEPLLQKALAQ